MNIFNSIQALPAVVERKRIDELLELSISVTERGFLRSLEYAKGLFPEKFKAANAEKYVNQYFNSTSYAKSIGIVAAIEKTTQALVDTAKQIQRDLNKLIPQTLTRDAITYKQAAVLEFTSNVDFYCNYVSSFVNYLLLSEAAQATNTPLQDLMSKSSILEIDEGWVRFMALSVAYSARNFSIVEDIRKASDVVMQAGGDEVVSKIHGYASVNPNKSGFIYIPTKWNPFYMIGSVWIHYLVDRHKIMEEKLKLFEAMLIHQKQIAEKSNDPAIMRRVEELTLIVDELKAKIEKSEKRYG